MTADLQDLFDQAGRNPPPASALDADVVLRRARRLRNRRNAVAVATAVVVTVVLVVGVASQRRMSADPAPADDLPTMPVLGSLGRLAYALDGDIYLADADGTNRVKVADGAPREGDSCDGYWVEGPIWSPDGRYLAFRGDGDERLSRTCDWTVNIRDSAGRRVASFPGDGWAIAWSPDSTRVAVWSDVFGDARLQIYGLDGVRQALLDMPPGWSPSADVDPVWSPDGASLLVPGGAEVPVDGSTPRLWPWDDPRSHLSARYSPDGTQIAYISPEGLGVAAADGSRERVLVPGGTDDFEDVPSRLVWSPRGDRIAFVKGAGATTSARRSAELAVLDVVSGTVVTLAETAGVVTYQHFEFSPEGDRILLTKADATGETSLWSVHAHGSELRRLVAGTSTGDWQTVVPAR